MFKKLFSVMFAAGLLAACETAPPSETLGVVGVEPTPIAGPSVGTERTRSSPFLSLAAGIDALAQNELFSAAVVDAKDTLNWIAVGDDFPREDKLAVAQASVCPNMVQLAVEDFRAKAKGWSDRLRALDAKAESEETSGPHFILIGTKLRYSTSKLTDPRVVLATIREDVYNRVSAVVNGCRNILPTKQLTKVVKIVTKAGIAATIPGGVLLSRISGS